jgi:hypothetical protein
MQAWAFMDSSLHGPSYVLTIAKKSQLYSVLVSCLLPATFWRVSSEYLNNESVKE